MELSRFNIVSGIKDSDEYFIINSLYGSADIIDQETYSCLLKRNLSKTIYADRGYLVDPESEKIRFREAYLKFLDDRETDEIQLFFVPGYTCNFNCSYCYQGAYNVGRSTFDMEVIQAFFAYIDEVFKNRRKYITLFGGEPLLPGKSHTNLIKYIIEGATERNTDVAIVTNGYHIADYIDIFKQAQIREIQVTIDGTRHVHNKRRSLKNGEGSFDRIVQGVDLLLENNIPVNLRVVVDRENIDDLPLLASFAIERGWTGSGHFSTQLGRNYELHDCNIKGELIYTRVELYIELYRLIKKYPHILEFHKPSFSVARALYENGELPAPLFDACPGTKTEWAFDYNGDIYACTATVGKKGEELGRFFPERVLYEEKVEDLTNRDILSIDECRVCSHSLLCGGGCAAVAKNQSGCIHNPDCRPVKELLELGIAAYFQSQTTK